MAPIVDGVDEYGKPYATRGSGAYVSQGHGSVRIVLDEDDAVSSKREGLVQRERQRRLWPWIHNHGVADLCEDDRVARGTVG